MKGGGHDTLEASSYVSFMNAIFGTLYTVLKEKGPLPSRPYAVAKMTLEWLQLALLMVSPAYGYTGLISNNNKGWNVISFVNLRYFLSTRNYQFYLGWFYLTITGLIVCICVCSWIGHSYLNNRFVIKWPIKAVRLYALLVFQLFDIAVMNILLVSLDCQYWTTNNPGINLAYPSVSCEYVHAFSSSWLSLTHFKNRLDQPGHNAVCLGNPFSDCFQSHVNLGGDR